MLFHVHCKLPNASTLINGVEFAAHEVEKGVMRTVKAVEEAVAAMFRDIPGYTIVPVEKPKKGASATDTKPAADADGGDNTDGAAKTLV